MQIRRRERNTHKGDYGRLLVVAGSLGMTGAAYLCCEAAVLSGAGLVTLAIPKSLSDTMARKLTEVMTLPVAETKEGTFSKKAYSKLSSFAKQCDCIAIGPGISQNREAQHLIRSLIRKLRRPMVIDADGLNAIAGDLNILKSRKRKKLTTIITPHPGEMSRLVRKSVAYIQKNRKDVARRFASEYNVSTVLKGHDTVVASPDKRVYINSTGNPGMASGGCGDVLTGIIAAFLAQGMDAFKAARLAVYIHGLSGDIAAKQKSEISLKATDLLQFLPEAFKKVYR